MSVASSIPAFLALVSLALALVSQPDFAREAIRLKNLQAGVNFIGARDAVPAGYTAAPYYPTPPGGWVSNWTAAYAKAQVMVANMTLAEKVNLTTGSGELMGPCVGNTGSAPRFGIPNLCLQDSALGVADTDSMFLTQIAFFLCEMLTSVQTTQHSLPASRLEQRSTKLSCTKEGWQLALKLEVKESIFN